MLFMDNIDLVEKEWNIGTSNEHLPDHFDGDSDFWY